MRRPNFFAGGRIFWLIWQKICLDGNTVGDRHNFQVTTSLFTRTGGNLSSGTNFVCVFCHQGNFLFFKPALNSASFDTHEVHIVKKKFFYPYTV
jgi:hypothetical protein